MRTRILASACVLSLLALVALAAAQDKKEEGKDRKGGEKPKAARLKAGDAAPAITVKSLDGKERTLDSFRGEKKDQIVVVNFWSHCCPWSRGWDAELSKIAADYKEKGVAFVVVDSNKPDHTDGTNKDTPEDIGRYRKEQKLSFEVFVDANHAVANAFGGKTTPDVFVIGKDGKIAYTGRIDDMQSPDGADKVKDRFLRSALDALLAGRAPATASTEPAGCGIKRAKLGT